MPKLRGRMSRENSEGAREKAKEKPRKRDEAIKKN
jgi:hypothetical protein